MNLIERIAFFGPVIICSIPSSLGQTPIPKVDLVPTPRLACPLTWEGPSNLLVQGDLLVHQAGTDDGSYERAVFGSDGLLISASWSADGVRRGLDASGTHWSLDTRSPQPDTVLWKSPGGPSHDICASLRVFPDSSYHVEVVSRAFPFHGFSRSVNKDRRTTRWWSLFPIQWSKDASCIRPFDYGQCRGMCYLDGPFYQSRAPNDHEVIRFAGGYPLMGSRTSGDWEIHTLFGPNGLDLAELSYLNGVLRQEEIRMGSGVVDTRLYDEQGNLKSKP